MKFCEKCGKELLDEAVICPGCGCTVKRSTGVQPAAEGPKASYDFAARSLVTNIISGVVLAAGAFVFWFVNMWIGIFFCLAAELVALIPFDRINKAFKQNGLTKSDKFRMKAIMKTLYKKFPGLIVARVLMCVCLACLIVFALLANALS